MDNHERKNVCMSIGSQDKKYRIEMLDKALRVLDFLYENEQASFIEIQKYLNYPKSTLHRILYTLEENNYVERHPVTEEYKLGKIFAFYGIKVRSNMTITNICEPILKELSIKIGETVNLSINYQDNVLNIMSIEGESSVLTSKLVPISPLNCSASGKILLCLKNDIDLMSYFKGNKWEQRTINSIISYDRFLEEKKSILEEGIAYDREEYEYGLFCMASFLQNHEGNINAAISVTGPRTRMEMKGIEFIKKELINSTSKINFILKNIQYSDNMILRY